MSVSNAQRLVTKQDLKDFYDGILPYLGGSADAGFTPIGTIISVMGVTAPANYLACNGQTVNIADYPELADYFYQQFGSKNKFGGDGTTTFGIPDLRGEFLRGTGTNSHTNQGNGANVGEHQDATNHKWVNFDSTNNIVAANASGSSGHQNAHYRDSFVTDTSSKGALYQTLQLDSNNKSFNDTYTSRPTNTSVLYCIATKNIYMNPSLDYSTSEKVVGTWIDGKPIYQRVVVVTENFDSNTVIDVPADELIDFYGIRVGISPSGEALYSTGSYYNEANDYFTAYGGKNSLGKLYCRAMGSNLANLTKVTYFFRYTKTTD